MLQPRFEPRQRGALAIGIADHEPAQFKAPHIGRIELHCPVSGSDGLGLIAADVAQAGDVDPQRGIFGRGLQRAGEGGVGCGKVAFGHFQPPEHPESVRRFVRCEACIAQPFAGAAQIVLGKVRLAHPGGYRRARGTGCERPAQQHFAGNAVTPAQRGAGLGHGARRSIARSLAGNRQCQGHKGRNRCQGARPAASAPDPAARTRGFRRGDHTA